MDLNTLPNGYYRALVNNQSDWLFNRYGRNEEDCVGIFVGSDAPYTNHKTRFAVSKSTRYRKMTYEEIQIFTKAFDTNKFNIKLKPFKEIELDSIYELW